MSGIIFNSVKAFVEQVGRRSQWKYGELDVLVSTWNGPQAGALQFKPQVGTPHPSFPLMFCTDSQITYQNALIAVVEGTYQGIIQSGGAKSYITPPITAESPTQGSRDFVDLFITSVGYPVVAYAPGGTGSAPGGVVLVQLYNVTTRNVTVRYVGRQCAVRYQSYPRPTGLKYSHLGLGRVQWTVLSVTYGASSTVATNVTATSAQQIKDVHYLQAAGQLPGIGQGVQLVGVPALYAANLGMQIEQRGQWYTCTEIYGPTF